MWIDSHCHVTADKFSEDRDEVLARATETGIDTLIAIGSGYGVASNANALALAERFPGQRGAPEIWATAGVHPHEASELDDQLRSHLREWLAHPRVVAIGECGLDYHYMNSPSPVQREVFAEQVGLAQEFDLPVVIHVRGDDPDAYGELLDIWLAEGGRDLSAVLHCYTGTLAFARRAVEAGFFVSFSGIVTFKASGELRETAKALPLDRLMVETDAPFLAPQGHRGKRNEPAWVPIVGETLATLHERDVEEVAEITSRNARRFFRLDERTSTAP
jgi:TatD DNase family protein